VKLEASKELDGALQEINQALNMTLNVVFGVEQLEKAQLIDDIIIPYLLRK